MEALLSFAQTASPLAILALFLVFLIIIVLQLVKGKNLLGGIINTQNKKYPIIEHTDDILVTLNRKIDTVMNNHLHELPDMKSTLDGLRESSRRMEEQHQKMLEVLTQINTKLK